MSTDERERLDRERQLRVEEAVAIAVKLAGALQVAHDRGIIHRDIKPANILLSNGEPLVADFGIALAVAQAGGGRLTETGLSVGTPHYMSPEQATGEPHIGPATDVYALGCVLYEMLTGDPPFTGSTSQAVLGRIIQGTLVRAREVRPSLPANVDAAIVKAVEKLPADRFENVTAFADALRNPHFTTATANAAAATTRTTLRGWVRHPASWISLATCLGLAVALWAGGRSRTPDAPVSRVETTIPSDYSSDIDLSRDGRRIVTRAGDSLYVRDLADLTPRVIPVSGVNPTLSRDGNWIAFASFGILYVVSAQSGSPTVIADSVVHCGHAWGDDGRIYFYRNGRLGRVRATGGAFEALNSPIRVRSGWCPGGVQDVLPGARGAIVRGVESETAGLDSMATWAVTFDGRVSRLDVRPGRERVRPIRGRYLAYVEPTPAGSSRLMVAPFDARALRTSGEPVVLVDNVTTASLSDEGTLIYTSEGIRWRGWFGNRAGDLLPVPGLDSLSWVYPRPSPDGRQIAWSRNGFPSREPENIWLLDRATRVARPLTFETESALREPIGWSPDGSRVYFSMRTSTGPDGPSRYRIMAVDAQDPLGVDTVFDHPTLSRSPSLAPDGRTVIWVPISDSEEARAGSAILRGTLGESGADVVLAVPRGRIISAPEVSPDGRWIAYASTESGTPQVHVQAFPAGGRKLQVTTDGAFFMFWARSSRSLFVSKADGMWETRLDLTAGQVLGQTLASQLMLWDGIMPGDSLFVGATPDLMPGEQPRFVLVQGILGEIRRLLEGQ